MDRPMTRAALAGLLRFPVLLSEKVEGVEAIFIDDERLARLRAIALDACFAGGSLEKEDLEAILRDAGLGTVIEELKATNALAFSFLRGNAEYNRAVQDLSATIDALTDIPMMDAALREATDKFRTDMSEAQWSEQQRLREALADAKRALTDLAQGGDGEGA
jgi:DNA primase